MAAKTAVDPGSGQQTANEQAYEKYDISISEKLQGIRKKSGAACGLAGRGG